MVTKVTWTYGAGVPIVTTRTRTEGDLSASRSFRQPGRRVNEPVGDETSTAGVLGESPPSRGHFVRYPGTKGEDLQANQGWLASPDPAYEAVRETATPARRSSIRASEATRLDVRNLAILDQATAPTFATAASAPPRRQQRLLQPPLYSNETRSRANTYDVSRGDDRPGRWIEERIVTTTFVSPPPEARPTRVVRTASAQPATARERSRTRESKRPLSPPPLRALPAPRRNPSPLPWENSTGPRARPRDTATTRTTAGPREVYQTVYNERRPRPSYAPQSLPIQSGPTRARRQSRGELSGNEEVPGPSRYREGPPRESRTVRFRTPSPSRQDTPRETRRRESIQPRDMPAWYRYEKYDAQ